METDQKFVRGLFLTLAWLASSAPLVYALVVHQWIWLGLVVLAECGVAVHIAIKNIT